MTHRYAYVREETDRSENLDFISSRISMMCPRSSRKTCGTPTTANWATEKHYGEQGKKTDTSKNRCLSLDGDTILSVGT